MRRFVLLLVALAIGWSLALPAREFRSIVLVPTPADTPLEGVPVAQLQPIERALVEQAVYALAAAWNTGELSPLLADDLADRQRLLDVLAEVVPPEARLEVLGIEAISTLDQRLQQTPQGDLVVSMVSAVVRTQVELADPVAGFLRLPGRNELYFRVEQHLDEVSGDAGG